MNVTDISSADLAVLRREAELTARRLMRRMDLPAQERDDLHQDLLLGLFRRLKDFDPRRGSLAAFAAVVARHGATLILARQRRHRALFAPSSLEDPISERDGVVLLDTLVEDDGYLAWMGSPTGQFATLEARLSVERALNALSPEHIRLCAELITGSIGAEERPSRATRYRHLHQVRLQVLAAGVGAP